MPRLLRLSYIGTAGALGAGLCCVLPMILMLVGIGGSGLAIFSRLAAAGYWLLAASAVILAAAWIVAWRYGSLRRLRWRLGGSTAVNVVAGLLILNEVRINDFLISLM